VGWLKVAGQKEGEGGGGVASVPARCVCSAVNLRSRNCSQYEGKQGYQTRDDADGGEHWCLLSFWKKE
jgi:hypothetical protein